MNLNRWEFTRSQSPWGRHLHANRVKQGPNPGPAFERIHRSPIPFKVDIPNARYGVKTPVVFCWLLPIARLCGNLSRGLQDSFVMCIVILTNTH